MKNSIRHISATCSGAYRHAYMLRASGTLDLIVSLLSPITNLIPAEVMPLALIRPISGSGATGILPKF